MVQLYFRAAFQPAPYFPSPLHNKKPTLSPQRLLILAKPRLMPLRIPISPPKPALRVFQAFIPVQVGPSCTYFLVRVISFASCLF